MKQRYRLKLTIINAAGSLAFALRLFPNALTFVGYPTQAQLEFVTSAASILGAFGISIDLQESK
jgi:spore maturation protein SpmB